MENRRRLVAMYNGDKSRRVPKSRKVALVGTFVMGTRHRRVPGPVMGTGPASKSRALAQASSKNHRPTRLAKGQPRTYAS